MSQIGFPSMVKLFLQICWPSMVCVWLEDGQLQKRILVSFRLLLELSALKGLRPHSGDGWIAAGCCWVLLQ